MKRLAISMMVVGLGLGAGAGHVFAAPSPIATAMGDLRWGLSEREVSAYAKRELADQYNAQVAKTKDASKQNQLRAESKRAQAQVDKSLTNFEAGPSSWDNSAIAGEFNYDHSESMLVSKSDTAETYYFFVGGKLWKYLTVLDKRAAGGGDFKKFSHSVEEKYGKGRAKKGELTPGQGSTQWIEYLDRASRMRAADNSGKRSGFAMIYEEMASVREMASLRPKKSAPAAEEEKAEPREAPAQIAKAPNKRSVFAPERREESETDYQSRKQKTADEARERAQRAHARKEDAKKGEVLKQLDGMNDSDPLGGL
ncbi:MAG: hypothetical protein RL701_5923 [Pseudomonadota bacterium]